MSLKKYGKCTVVILCVQIIFVFYTAILFFNHSPKPREVEHSRDTNNPIEYIHKNAVYYLYVIILSHPSNKDRRDCIRKTWLSTIDVTKQGIGYKFVIGIQNGKDDDDTLNLLNEEIKYEGDILLLNNIIEHPKTLSKKIIETFKWLDTNIDTTYILKCDDDSYVAIDKLAGTIQTEDLPDKRYYWGYFKGNGTPHKRGKWLENGWFLCDTYLPFALGGGYILTADLVHYISINGDYFSLYGNEDVNIGTILAPIDITRRHDLRFNTEYLSRGCSNQYIVSHKHSIDEMESMHRNWLNTGNICIEEKILRPSYNYDWSANPSQCCIKSTEFKY